MTNLESLLQTAKNIKVIDSSINYDQYTPIDLSVSNSQLSIAAVTNQKDFGEYINAFLAENNASVAYGGYNEERNIYRRSTIFKDNDADERNIHIGLDIWLKAGTPVLAAFDGVVHSFNYNAGVGDYGPTIILEHILENQVFYTLYGHLSLDSIENLKTGTIFKQGQQLAALGDVAINGDYPPHLHFQIIKDIGAYSGDYPGVCSKNDRDYFLENCPNPNLILQITS